MKIDKWIIFPESQYVNSNPEPWALQKKYIYEYQIYKIN